MASRLENSGFEINYLQNKVELDSALVIIISVKEDLLGHSFQLWMAGLLPITHFLLF